MAGIINPFDFVMRDQHVGQLFSIVAMALYPHMQCFQRFQHDPCVKRREAGAGLADEIGQLIFDIIAIAQNNAAKTASLPVNMFGRRINGDVGAQSHRLLQNRCGEHIIDNQAAAVIMGNIGNRLNVDDFQYRVGRSFQKQQFGFRAQGRLPGFKVAPVHQSAGNAETRH